MKSVQLTLAAAVVLWATSAQALEIPLSVAEPAGTNRTAEPVSGGIPLPTGRFKPDQPFALFDGDREVPVQTLPLVVGADGSVRWVLLDFQADLDAGQTRAFTLKAATPKAAPVSPMKVTDGADAVTIDTGAVRIVIARDKPFGLFDSVSINGKPIVAGATARYTDAFDGKTYPADKPDGVVVEYSGPLRATVCVKGRFVGDEHSRLGYVARLTAWAGRSDVHLKYSLANSNPDHYSYRQIRDSSISLAPAGPITGSIVGAGKPLDAGAGAALRQNSRSVSAVAHTSDSLGPASWLRQTVEQGAASATDGEKVLWTSSGRVDRAGGWLAARVGDSLVFVDDLYFVEDPPRRLALSDSAIVLSGVIPPADGERLPFASRDRWLFDCSHLSSQYVIDFAAPADGEELSARARTDRARLWVMAEPGWYFDTEALPVGRFGTQADELACYRTWGWKYDDREIPTAPAGRMANVPRWVAADDNHFTSEQDTAETLILMYLRTGRRSFFDAAEAWVNYFADLQTWRTDGWRWKDGGVWKLKQGGKGPLGNRPQRAADPVTGQREHLYGAWENKAPFDATSRRDLFVLANAKSCSCHNWGEGLVQWFMLTGDRDVFEAALDTVAQQIDTQARAFGKAPGQPGAFSRDFTRASYLTHATRLIAADDPFVVDASDYLASVYLKRTDPEPRGLLNGPGGVTAAIIQQKTGGHGLAEMKRLGIELDERTGELVDPKSGARWMPVIDPHTWMFPPLSRAMGLYYRITGNEGAMDWTIAYGQAVARVLYQPRHGNLSGGNLLVDFPVRGVAHDLASWQLSGDPAAAAKVAVSGYLGGFHPDVPARGYSLCGEPLLKQRAYDYWLAASHRWTPAGLSGADRVGTWVNCYSTHNESVCYTGRTFYEWSHPRADAEPPDPVTDLAVSITGQTATVAFTVPTDRGGGRVIRVQVKCSDRPIVDYETFLTRFAAHTDAAVCNWWMAANLDGEPGADRLARPGQKITFQVTGVPEGATFFAVRAFDDSNNRSAISNVVGAK